MRPSRIAFVVSVWVLAGAACGSSTPQPKARPAGGVTPSAHAPSPSTSAPSTSAPSTSAASTTTTKRTTTTPTTIADPTTAVAAFTGTVVAITTADVPRTWHPGCPVGPDQLRMLHMSYWGFDGSAHVGTMVVNAAVAPSVLAVFARLYSDRFPIRRMVPEDAFGGSDPASMSADNTSGFNCRNAVAPGAPHWSAHAYGEAIDVNPVENPYLEGGAVQPAAGSAFLDRSARRPGMAYPGGELVAAFAAVGWPWGGRWSAPDYQHFSASGG